MIEYLFDHLGEIEDIIKIKKENLALFLDYDGTLVPFKDRPEDATPPNALIGILKRLVDRRKFVIWIISGRMIDEIEEMLPIKGLHFAGLHGLQIDFPNGKFVWDGAKESIPILDKIKKEVFAKFGNENAIRIKDKIFTLALNYRCFTGEIGKLKEKFVEIVSKYNDGTLEIIHGAKILEVRPKGWNKGTAVEMILKKIPNAMPIYIGDDRTDEDAFNYINSIDGITIIANEKEANAKFYLRGQREVLSFLNILSEWSD